MRNKILQQNDIDIFLTDFLDLDSNSRIFSFWIPFSQIFMDCLATLAYQHVQLLRLMNM